MSLKQIGTNSVNEFFEDLTYSIAYNEIMNRLNDLLPLDEGYLKNALESSINVLASGALFYFIQKQEDFVNYIIKSVEVIIVGLLSNLAGFGDKLKNVKGVRSIIKFFGYSDDRKVRISTARLVNDIGNSIITSSDTKNNASSNLNSLHSFKSNQYQADEFNLNYAKAKASMINQQMLFKLFTKKFTPADKEMIRKMTGNSKIDIDSLNKIADFMFITDNNGDITGLSEQFMRLVNGLGYTHNKGGKNG